MNNIAEITEEDKKYIQSTNGIFSTRGIRDTLKVVEQEFGEDVVNEITEKMENLGFAINSSIRGEKEGVDASFFVMLVLVIKKHLNLNDEELQKIAINAAKLSFLLRFASKLMISVNVLFDNADMAWKKYYIKGGQLFPLKLDQENNYMLLEVRDFIGHPTHCCYLEGYIQQIVHFVTRKDTTCKEEECIFKGGSVHRYRVSWEK